MILLALGIAVLDAHTRLAHLETDATPLLLAALGAAACRHYFMIAHVGKLLRVLVEVCRRVDNDVSVVKTLLLPRLVPAKWRYHNAFIKNCP
jgi:hypothetical protein